MKNNKKGISLIVLTITIIVVVILAAITIMKLQSTNAIDKAEEAADATSISRQYDQIEMMQMNVYKATGKMIDDETRDEMIEIFKVTGVSVSSLTVYVDKYNINQNKENGTNLQTMYICYRYDKTTEEEQNLLETCGIPMLMGDANMDGFLTQEDADLILANEAGSIAEELSEMQLHICDIDDSDSGEWADSTDAGYVEEFIQGLHHYEGGNI